MTASVPENSTVVLTGSLGDVVLSALITHLSLVPTVIAAGRAEKCVLLSEPMLVP